MCPKLSSISVEDVLSIYKDIISEFDHSQTLEWTRWKGNLPERVARVKNEHLKARDKVDFWQNLAYLFIILSAAIPIIVGILVTVNVLGSMTSLLDAVFPAVVGVVQKKLSVWSERRHAFAQVVSPYTTLLNEIVIDIYEKKYSDEKHKINQNKWENLDGIIRDYL